MSYDVLAWSGERNSLLWPQKRHTDIYWQSCGDKAGFDLQSLPAFPSCGQSPLDGLATMYPSLDLHRSTGMQSLLHHYLCDILICDLFLVGSKHCPLSSSAYKPTNLTRKTYPTRMEEVTRIINRSNFNKCTFWLCVLITQCAIWSHVVWRFPFWYHKSLSLLWLDN